MRRMTAIGAAALAMCAAPASAGIYTDDLSRCLVAKASPADLTVFMRWMFAAMSASAAVRDMANVTEPMREAQNRAAAALFSRLMLVDCRPQTVAALKYEGALAIESSFNVFGQVAARGLFSDPDVARELGKLGGSIDSAQFKALGREAGVPEVKVPPAATPK